MKPIHIILIIIGVILLLLFIDNNNKNARKTQTLAFTLPTSPDPTVFGPYYWNAYHTLAKNVPCPACRGFAEKFTVFFHDTVNMKLNKPLYDPQNFKYFTNLFANINRGENPFAEQH